MLEWCATWVLRETIDWWDSGITCAKQKSSIRYTQGKKDNESISLRYGHVTIIGNNVNDMSSYKLQGVLKLYMLARLMCVIPTYPPL